MRNKCGPVFQSPTAIDLFAGAGGLSEGFMQAGFEVLAGIDSNDDCARTYRVAHPNSEFICDEIQNISAERILKTTGLKCGELDCLLGGPPCQAFSINNHKRGMFDERSYLFKEYLRVVSGLLPKWIVMENVTGILSVDNGQVVSAIERDLTDLGYENVEYKTLRAEEYGVPQGRRRVFFIANREGTPFEWPKPFLKMKKGRMVTVDDAISDLPVLHNGEGEDIQEYRCSASQSSCFQKKLRRGSRRVFNHVAPRLSEVNLARIKHIPQGGNWTDIPFNLLPSGMQRARRSDHTKRYGRLSPMGLSSTILTKCDIHWGAFIHPYQDRGLTVREAARLQSFPDRYVFFGPRTEQYRQVGNAVPPVLAKAIADYTIGPHVMK